MDDGRLSSLLSLNEHVILDGYQTWPSNVRNYLRENEVELRGFIAREREIDNAARKRVELRWNRPTNEFQSAWDSGKSEVRCQINGRKFVGFHCTRLTDHEVKDVAKHGLTPLSATLLEKRLLQVETSGELPHQVATMIRQRNDISEPVRSGRTSVFHCVEGLRDAGGLYRLFRAWGGEAVYRQHETNPKTFTALRRVGKPCIVVLSIDYEDVFSYPTVEERLIKIFVLRNDDQFLGGDTDSHVPRPLPVLDIVPIEDPRFKVLTEYDQWSDPIL